ncbi:MAG: anthranilate synthase component I, partial [Pirellula sp.]
MTTFPSFETYRDLYERFDIVPVYRRLLSDHLTPVSAFRLLDDGTSSAGLFESVIGGEKIGRYSFIAVEPRARVVAYGSNVQYYTDGKLEEFQSPDPLEFLSKQLGNQSIATVDQLPPFVGGAIGYAGYDVVRYVENLPNIPNDDRQLPDLDFGFYDQLVVFDHVNKTIMVVVLSHTNQGESPEQAYA